MTSTVLEIPDPETSVAVHVNVAWKESKAARFAVKAEVAEFGAVGAIWVSPNTRSHVYVYGPPTPPPAVAVATAVVTTPAPALLANKDAGDTATVTGDIRRVWNIILCPVT